MLLHEDRAFGRPFSGRRQLRRCRGIELSRRHPLESIEHEICRPHLGHPAIRGFGAGEAAVLGQLVDRLATTAYRKIFALVAAHRHAGVDVRPHPGEDGAVAEIHQRVAADVAQDKIVIGRVFKAQELRREGRDVAGTIHAGDRKRLDQLIAERRLLGSDDLLQRLFDLAQECDLARRGRRKSPEFAQKPIIGSLDARLAKRLRDVVAL